MALGRRRAMQLIGWGGVCVFVAWSGGSVYSEFERRSRRKNIIVATPRPVEPTPTSTSESPAEFVPAPEIQLEQAPKTQEGLCGENLVGKNICLVTKDETVCGRAYGADGSWRVEEYRSRFDRPIRSCKQGERWYENPNKER